MIKTGEVFDRDEDDQLWLCESWLDEKTGKITSTRKKVIVDENGNEVVDKGNL